MSNNQGGEVEIRGANDMAFLVPAQEAGRLLNYTADYITKLARDGKIRGRKDGRNWMVDLQSAKAFMVRNEEEKRLRNEQIRQERLREQQAFRKDTLHNDLGNHDLEIVPSHFTRDAAVALTHTLTIMLLGLMVGLGGYAVMQTTIPAQNASLWSAIEGIALSLYNTVTPEDEVIVTIPEPEIITTHTALIVAPDEIMTDTAIEEIRDSFSDDVSISMDPENPDTGMIIPHWRDRDGEAYRFLVAPVNPNTGS